jgi:hypothetical protein
MYTKNGAQTASFKSAAKVPLTSAIITFGPTQSGSGDPSPDNIRPISGLNELNITLCGKNLFNISSYPLKQGYWIGHHNGELYQSSVFAAAGNPTRIPIKHL